MKTEDFERLKQICEKEGFEVNVFTPINGLFEITKKDPWEGVEFVESGIDGMILPIKDIGDNVIFTRDRLICKNSGKPSTETAYVEQLKRIAKEKFGDIKEGDRFDRINLGYNGELRYSYINGRSNVFLYYKHDDSLYYSGWLIYANGKWAERVKEMVKVDYDSWTVSNSRFVIHFEHNENDFTKFDRVSEFLCKQLENYLNDEKGN